VARVPTWPDDRQRELAELALEIEAELAGTEYDATPNELAAIDEGMVEEAASDAEVKAAFAAVQALPANDSASITRASDERERS
jgi:hypothetical protein